MANNKERLLAGKLYKSEGEEIAQMKRHGRRLSYLFNQTAPDENEKREQIIRELFGTAGKHIYVKAPFYCSHGSNISVGDNCFINFDCIFLDLNTITLGHNVMIGPRVSIYTASHPIDLDVRKSGLEYALPVTIENDVWIAGSVTINPGVTIGEGTIIGSGSVVTKSIPPMVIAAGNPCKVIRQITAEDRQYWQDQQADYMAEL
ncbi:sugar O-acetyltransferase [Beduini massiliensis]|uniref:sugar O-acetyltransferase n=1 Tax=Beduini massiliensis TaxID=1585974 RepID=UPI00059AA9C0|nr:sugar O-acetyltransferase [Beduini massiliensis]